MTRLLFITPGNNLQHIHHALEEVCAQQKVTLQVRGILAYQVMEGLVGDDELRQAIRDADIVLFDIRVNPRAVQALREVRAEDERKTFIPLMGGSMEVLSLCRMGSFNMDRMASRPSGGAAPNFRRIQQITDTIEKLGGLLPVGALKHARNWVHCIRYWTAGGAQNIHHLLSLVAREYASGKGKAAPAPREKPALRVEDPADEQAFTSTRAFLKAHPLNADLPTVAVLYYGGMHRDASVVGVEALRNAFAGSANVLPIASDGVQTLDAVRQFLCAKGSPRVDGLISLMWFRLNGGPLGGAEDETVEALSTLDVPFMVPACMYNREWLRWQGGQEGLSPVETYATMVLPELDGALGPVPLLGLEREDVGGLQVTRAHAPADRARLIAERMLAWVALRNKPRSQRRLALVVYDYPPGPGSVGNASYLDVGESLTSMLAHLQRDGYQVQLPEQHPLRMLMDQGIHNANLHEEWHGESLEVPSYVRWYASLPQAVRTNVESVFGAAPGQYMVDDAGIRIPGVWLGNVLLCLQPSRHPVQEGSQHAHDRSLPPHHQYLAFYRYLAEQGVDAVVHVGTHGTAEFTPGKETGLSAECFPEILSGTIPQVYLYTLANPSEASVAKRRWHAALISHHVPDFVPAQLYGDYQELLDGLERAKDTGLSKANRARVLEETLARAAELGLPAEDQETLEHELVDLKQAAIPQGLHVFGQAKTGASLLRYLVQLFKRQVASIHVESLLRPGEDHAVLDAWATAFVKEGKLPRELAKRVKHGNAATLEEELIGIARAFLESRELEGLSAGLDGGYLRPGLLGDALRSPRVYPTGRNGCAFDPTRIPFADALQRGEQLGCALLEQHVAQHGRPPRTVALVLWGFETARTGGDTLGQVLHLVGARAKQGAGWLPSFEPIPLTELGRPRVDVVLMICGFFRDMFPTLVKELDELFRTLASLDEPPELNPLAAHARELTSTVGPTLSAARIWGPPPGEYGTGMTERVESSRWKEQSDLGMIYEEAMGHAYGAHHHGEGGHSTLREMLARTEVVSQVVDGEEYKIGDLDHYYEFLGGAVRAVENRRGAKPACVVGDTARQTPRVSDAQTELNRYSISRLLNPRWIDGMLAHDLHGGRKIEERITNLVGLAATVGVPDGLFDRVFERYVADEELFNRLRENNVHAAAALVRRMSEADQRELWNATDEQRAVLKQRHGAVDGDLEEG